jgi:hypothetical protein
MKQETPSTFAIYRPWAESCAVEEVTKVVRVLSTLYVKASKVEKTGANTEFIPLLKLIQGRASFLFDVTEHKDNKQAAQWAALVDAALWLERAFRYHSATPQLFEPAFFLENAEREAMERFKEYLDRAEH